MPVEQTCPRCGSRFMGSDCIGDPCPSCMYGTLFPPAGEQDDTLDARIAEARQAIAEHPPGIRDALSAYFRPGSDT